MKVLPVLAAVGALFCVAADDPTTNLCNAPVTETAVKYLGTPYVRAGESPARGFDCSGFTRYVFEESCGFGLPRSSTDQSRTGVKIPKTDLQPGDLVVFREPRRLHMGLYLGDGRFIHAPNRRGKVRVESLESEHFKRAFREGRRVLGPVELSEASTQEEPVVKKPLAKRKVAAKKKAPAKKRAVARRPASPKKKSVGKPQPRPGTSSAKPTAKR